MTDRLIFSGHDSFQCRPFWLKKGFDFINSGRSFRDRDAVVYLGVGKNMISAIRYWLKAFSIIDDSEIPTEIGKKIFNDDGYDPYLENEGTIWLLHYLLVSTNHASIFNIIFNEFRKERITFSKSLFISYLRRYSPLGESVTFNENTVGDDFDVFIKTYYSSSLNPLVEEGQAGILTELELIQKHGSGRSEAYQIGNTDRESLPVHIFLFALLNNKQYGISINLSHIENGINSPGSIFAINRSGIDRLVKKSVELFGKNISFSDHAGVRELQFIKKPDPLKILEKFYD